ncbi:MAG: hypothetical protein QOH64_414 [Acidimicrobiaceae bacterium]
MGKHGDVAGVDVVGAGAHALGSESLQLGMDGSVVVGHDVPAGLRLPGGALHLLIEQVRVGWDVGCPDEFLLLFGEISCEALHAVWAQPDMAVREFDVGEDVRGRELVLLALRRLGFVRGERSDVDQPGNAVIGTCGGDLAEDLPVLDLGVGLLARSVLLGVGGVDVLLVAI